MRTLAARAAVSSSTIHKIENGARASIGMYVRVAKALDREFACQLVDPTGRRDAVRDDADIVHAAMGELEVATLRSHGFRTGLDEPWQHYHFAGRADVLGWDTALSALLRIENRTRFPDVQDSIGRFKNEQRYLVTALWRPLGFERLPRTELHVMVGLWSAEVLRVLRQRPETSVPLPTRPSRLRMDGGRGRRGRRGPRSCCSTPSRPAGGDVHTSGGGASQRPTAFRGYADAANGRALR